jgi:hypothetical protein
MDIFCMLAIGPILGFILASASIAGAGAWIYQSLYETGLLEKWGIGGKSPGTLNMEILQQQLASTTKIGEAQQLASDNYLQWLTKNNKEAAEQLKAERADQRAYEQKNMQQQFLMGMLSQQAAKEPSLTQTIGQAAQLANPPEAPAMPTGGGNLDVFMPEFPIAALLQ